jgi:3-dehydroquinate dehydratase
MAKVISVVSQTNTKVNTSLDKEELKNLSQVSSNAVFSNESNWRLVVGVFKHTSSRRRMVCAFKSNFTSMVPMRIRSGTEAGDAYELRKILIVGKNNQGILSIPRAQVPSASDYDFEIGEVAAPENFSATISSSSSYQVYAPFSASLVFGKSVTNFNLSKLSIANGVASNLTGSGANYSFTVTPNGEGTVSVSVSSNQVSASDGSFNQGSNSFQRAFYAPVTATLSSTAGGSSFSEPFAVSVEFSKSVTGLQLSDLSITNGVASNLTGSGANYSFLVTPSEDGEISIELNMDSVVASDGSTNSSSSSLSGIQYSTPATVSITTSSNSAAEPFTVDVTFSKPVTGFELSDLSIANGVASNLTGSGANYSFTVTPSADGAVSVSINPSSVSTAAGNTNDGSNSMKVKYTTQETLSISSASNSASAPFTVDVTFNKPVTGFELSDISLTNGVASNLTGSGANYSFTVTPSADGAVSVSINPSSVSTAAGNTNDGSNSMNVSYVSPLTVSLSSSVSNTVNSSFAVDAVFNKPVTGFELSDISLTNGVASNLTGSDANYSFTVTPSADGAVSVSIDSSASISGPSNEQLSSSSGTISTTYVDLNTLTIDSAAGYSTGGSVSAYLNNQLVFGSRPLTATQIASYDFNPGDNVELRAEADLDNYFAGYNGSITSSSRVSNVLMNDDKYVTAAFNKSFNNVHKFAITSQTGNIILPNGKILFYGFNNVTTHSTCNKKQSSIFILNQDWTIDDSFAEISFDNIINDVAVDSSGNIWVGGTFTSFTGPISSEASAAGITSGQANNANRFAKLNSNGVLQKISAGDVAGTTGNGFNQSVTCITINGSDIWVGGNFSSYFGATSYGTRGAAYNANFLVKLNNDGVLQKINAADTAGFSGNGFNSIVNCITIDSSGNIWAGGSFSACYVGSVSVTNVRSIAKLNSSGVLQKTSAGDVYFNRQWV